MSEQCLCAMFLFQLWSLHISKDVSYNYNNLVVNLVYQIPMTSFQGRKWVVGCGCYCIVGNSLTHNSQETILMPGTTMFVGKIMKQKHEVNDIWLLSLIKPFSSDFIELSNSSLSDDLTPHSSFIVLSILIF